MSLGALSKRTRRSGSAGVPQYIDFEKIEMHDSELENAVLLDDEAAVVLILRGDRTQALTTDGQGRTLLMTAVSTGQGLEGVSEAILGRLLDAGVDVNAEDAEGNTALGLAAEGCPVEILQFLLKRGADPNRGQPLIGRLIGDMTDKEGLKLLIAAGADPLAQEFDGMNALEWAEDGGDEESIRILKRAARRGRKRDA